VSLGRVEKEFLCEGEAKKKEKRTMFQISQKPKECINQTLSVRKNKNKNQGKRTGLLPSEGVKIGGKGCKRKRGGLVDRVLKAKSYPQ